MARACVSRAAMALCVGVWGAHTGSRVTTHGGCGDCFDNAWALVARAGVELSVHFSWFIMVGGCGRWGRGAAETQTAERGSSVADARGVG
eukprot:6103370-Prymnesium_polylepis.2